MAKTTSEKSKYRLLRESLQLTREQAGELLGCITPERIERIENEKFMPTPEEVRIMAKAYKAPELCNHYCVNQCDIGKEFATEVKIADISQIVLEMIDSLNTVDQEKNRIVQIAVDGVIGDDEIPDFIKIQDDLERVSMTVNALQLWVERMKSSGKINNDLYEKYRAEK